MNYNNINQALFVYLPYLTQQVAQGTSTAQGA